MYTSDAPHMVATMMDIITRLSRRPLDRHTWRNERFIMMMAILDVPIMSYLDGYEIAAFSLSSVRSYRIIHYGTSDYMYISQLDVCVYVTHS